MKDRILKIRKDQKLTQDDFAKKLNLSKNYIWQIEKAERVPSDRTISDICRIFNVDEKWLKTGEGDMYLPAEDEEAAYLSELLFDTDNDLYSLIKAIMKTYSESGDREKEIIKSFAKGLRDNIKSRD